MKSRFSKFSETEYGRSSARICLKPSFHPGVQMFRRLDVQTFGHTFERRSFTQKRYRSKLLKKEKKKWKSFPSFEFFDFTARRAFRSQVSLCPAKFNRRENQRHKQVGFAQTAPGIRLVLSFPRPVRQTLFPLMIQLGLSLSSALNLYCLRRRVLLQLLRKRLRFLSVIFFL